jgi:hypothetical protein
VARRPHPPERRRRARALPVRHHRAPRRRLCPLRAVLLRQPPCPVRQTLRHLPAKPRTRRRQLRRPSAAHLR